MSAVVVLQARMGSTRLPGKVLADLGGRTVLDLLLERAMRAPVDAVVLATSDSEQDDAVADVGTRVGVPVVRGPEHDVLARFRMALDRHPADDVVRLTGDCPLVDPELIALALDRHRQAGADYTSNTLVRTFPDGLDVEVVRAVALRTADAEAVDADEREHVTPFLYRRPERFRLAAFANDRFLGDERWTLDTADDLAFLRAVVARLPGADFGWQDVLAVADVGVPSSPRLVPAADSEPGLRRWDLVVDDGVRGSVEVAVHEGVGTAALEVPDDLRDVAEGLLRQRLEADLQVRELVTAR